MPSKSTAPEAPTFETKDAAIEAYQSGREGYMAVVNQARAEHAAVKAARSAKKPLAPTPAMAALDELHEKGVKAPTGKARSNGNGSTGPNVNLTDDQLRDEVVPELFAAGHHTVGAMTKALRGTPRGTNPKRMKRAYDAAVAAGKIDPSSITKPERATKKANGAPRKAAAKKAADQSPSDIARSQRAQERSSARRQVTPRPKGETRKRANKRAR